MRAARVILVLLAALVAPALLLITTAANQVDPAALDADPQVRFQAVDVFVDSGDQPLAAYQLDLQAVSGDVRIVGIEGGEHAAFSQPPYYDPAAMQQERVIIAAFSTLPAESLPRGRSRIATIHVQVRGDIDPQYDVKLAASATAEGAPLTLTVTSQTRQAP